MRILQLTYGVPSPTGGGSRIRDFYLLREVAKSAEVDLWCVGEPDRPLPDLQPLRAMCRTVEIFHPPRRSAIASLAGALLHRGPLATAPFYFSELESALRTAAAGRIDIFQIEHSLLAPYRVAAPAGCPTVLSLHNLGWLQYQRIARLNTGLRRPLYALKAALMRGWEARLAGRFDRVVTVSETEAALLRRADPALQVSVVANGVDCAELLPLPANPQCARILFTGAMAYPPNADAIRFFTARVLPLVQREVPAASFCVAGQEPPADLRALAATGAFTLHADVPAMRPYYEDAGIAVAPLRAGGGTRLKILEAMAIGRPVVSTTIGAEGLDVRHEHDILIADSAEGFAAAVVRLVRDAELWGRLVSNARRTVEQRYDWPAIGAGLVDVYRGLLTR